MKKIMITIVMLLIITQTHYSLSMENATTITFDDPTILSLITAQLCADHQYLPKNIKPIICDLKLISKSCAQYYTQEKNAHPIIKLCSLNGNSNDAYVAKKIGFPHIAQQIDYYATIARDHKKTFTKNELKNYWYLNSTTNCVNKSILVLAIDHLNLDVAQQIIDNAIGLTLYYDINRNILLKIANLRSKHRLIHRHKKGECEILLSIAESLLKRGILVDGKGNDCTALQAAANNGDKVFANLLLEYDADPTLTQYNPFTEESRNAFELEKGEPKGWLAEMVKKRNYSNIARMNLQYAEEQQRKQDAQALNANLLKMLCSNDLEQVEREFENL